MNKADSYKLANQMQRQDAEIIMQEKHLKWRNDGEDKLLDVGCGSGDVLMDFIYPTMPSNYNLLLGTDISMNMIDFARKHYASDERIKFEQLDIASESLPSKLFNQFDHVTSFYCLHWIQNQKLALKNIYKLLSPNGGDCLLIFLASSTIFEIYKALSQTSKWSPYMIDAKNFISPLQFVENPVQEIKKHLRDAGFTDYKVEMRNRIHTFNSVEALKSSIEAVCPFLERMSSNLQSEFMHDVLKAAENMNTHGLIDVNGNYGHTAPYKLMVVHACKIVVASNERLLKG